MAAVDEPLIVSRDIDLDLSADELWSLIADGEGWETWLVDEAEVAVETGATGVVYDQGQTREVRLDDVVAGERVSFEWWPAGRPGHASAVELVVTPSPSGAVLHVTETFPPRSRTRASAAWFTWEVRALAAWAGVGSPRLYMTTPARRAAPRREPGWSPLDELFAAVADPTRRQILQRLVHDGPQTATQLAEHFPLSRQAVVKHIQTLGTAGLVAPTRAGREVRYRATTEQLSEAVSWLLDTSAQWDRRADRLTARASRGTRRGVRRAPGDG